MRVFIAIAVCAALIGSANGQFVYSGNLAFFVPGDDPNASGVTQVRTEGDTLFFESTLNNARDVTGVHLHLQPSPGNLTGGPLILALTNTTAANGQQPLSSQPNQPLVQSGTRSTANLLANPNLPAVRNLLAQRGINGNDVQNIGDVDRLLALGVVYSDVHTLERVSPNRLISGAMTTIGQPSSVVQPGTQPSSVVQQPGTVVQQPGTVVQQPGTVVQQPDTVVQPSPVVQQPGVVQPSPVVQQPGVVQPSPVVQQPGGDQSSPVVQQPGGDQSSPVVQQPGGDQSSPVVQQPGGDQSSPVVQQPGGDQSSPVVQQPGGDQSSPVVQQPGVVQQSPVVQQPGRRLLVVA